MKVYGYLSSYLHASDSCIEKSLEQKEIKNYCNRENHKLMSIYIDELKASDNLLGPEFEKMIKDMVLYNISTLIIDSFGRLTAHNPLFEYLFYYLAAKNIDVISVDSGLVITKEIKNDPIKKIMVLLHRQLGELDRSLNMLKLRKSRENIRKKTGKCEGRKSYMEIAPDLIKEIKKLRRKRMGLRPRTYVDIAKKLNESGYLTASGSHFTGNNVSVILHRLKAA